MTDKSLVNNNSTNRQRNEFKSYNEMDTKSFIFRLENICRDNGIQHNKDGEPTVLNIKTVNSTKKTSIESKVKILDMDEKIYNIPDISFNSYITMPSSDFQNYILELSNVSDVIQFKSNAKELILSAKGDFAEQQIRINESNYTLEDGENYESGTFNVKYILLFCKSSNLCSTIEIYLKSDFPLTILYNIANLGKIKYCLAPRKNTSV
jgi:proliferating cell nuclear antigen